MDWDDTSAGLRRFLLTRGRSVDTATTYVAHLRPYYRWSLGQRVEPCGASRLHVEEFLADQLARVSRSTAHVRLSAIKAYYLWLRDLGERQDDPTLGLVVRKEKHQPRPPIDQPSFCRLIDSAKDECERLMLLVGYRCGLRISEIVGIRKQDLTPSRGLILIKGKGSKERWVCPDPDTMKRLQAYARERTGHLFPFDRVQARRIMKRIARNAGVDNFYPHRLRISFGNQFMEETHDLHSLQILMGHADPSVTAHYAAFTAQERALTQMRRFGLST